MSIVITTNSPKGKRTSKETTILLSYGSPLTEIRVEREKRAIAKGRGVEASELTEKRVGE